MGKDITRLSSVPLRFLSEAVEIRHRTQEVQHCLILQGSDKIVHMHKGDPQQVFGEVQSSVHRNDAAEVPAIQNERTPKRGGKGS